MWSWITSSFFWQWIFLSACGWSVLRPFCRHLKVELKNQLSFNLLGSMFEQRHGPLFNVFRFESCWKLDFWWLCMQFRCPRFVLNSQWGCQQANHCLSIDLAGSLAKKTVTTDFLDLDWRLKLSITLIYFVSGWNSFWWNSQNSE